MNDNFGFALDEAFCFETLFCPKLSFLSIQKMQKFSNLPKYSIQTEFAAATNHVIAIPGGNFNFIDRFLSNSF